MAHFEQFFFILISKPIGMIIMKNKLVLFLIIISFSMLITPALTSASSATIENLVVNLNGNQDIAIDNAIST